MQTCMRTDACVHTILLVERDYWYVGVHWPIGCTYVLHSAVGEPVDMCRYELSGCHSFGGVQHHPSAHTLPHLLKYVSQQLTLDLYQPIHQYQHS